jgi:hypothetical protein
VWFELEDSILPKDIFLQTELFDGRSQLYCKYDFYKEPTNLAPVLTRAEGCGCHDHQNSIYELLVGIGISSIDSFFKRDIYDLALNINLESPIDLFIQEETNIVSVDLLLDHFSSRKRNRNHYIVMMKLFENSFFENEFHSSLATLLNDKESHIEFGEEDPIFNNPKISWAVKNHSDFVATAPKIKTFAHSINWI